MEHDVSEKLTVSLFGVLRHGYESLEYGAVGGLNGVKPNERVVKCGWVKFD
jgi:hypothetical protein